MRSSLPWDLHTFSVLWCFSILVGWTLVINLTNSIFTSGVALRVLLHPSHLICTRTQWNPQIAAWWQREIMREPGVTRNECSRGTHTALKWTQQYKLGKYKVSFLFYHLNTDFKKVNVSMSVFPSYHLIGAHEPCAEHCIPKGTTLLEIPNTDPDLGGRKRLRTIAGQNKW